MIYIYVYKGVCVCVCVRERERERERERVLNIYREVKEDEKLRLVESDWKKKIYMYCELNLGW